MDEEKGDPVDLRLDDADDPVQGVERQAPRRAPSPGGPGGRSMPGSAPRRRGHQAGPSGRLGSDRGNSPGSGRRWRRPRGRSTPAQKHWRRGKGYSLTRSVTKGRRPAARDHPLALRRRVGVRLPVGLGCGMRDRRRDWCFAVDGAADPVRRAAGRAASGRKTEASPAWDETWPPIRFGAPPDGRPSGRKRGLAGVGRKPGRRSGSARRRTGGRPAANGAFAGVARTWPGGA